MSEPDNEYKNQLLRLEKLISDNTIETVFTHTALDFKFMARQGIDLARLQSQTIDSMKKRHENLRDKIAKMADGYCDDGKVHQQLREILILDDQQKIE